MEVIIQYPIQVEHWIHEPIEYFLGLILDNGYRYVLGITPEDPNEPDCCYFNVWVEKIMENQTKNKVVFYAKTYSCFKVRNRFQKPSSQFYFNLIDKATYEFATLFSKATRNTNLSHHRIHKPRFIDIRGIIEKTIDTWNETARNHIFLTQPDWQTTFGDLPEIPKYKRWVKGSYTTIEQDIAMRLQKGRHVTAKQESIFNELAQFYLELNRKLELLDYQSFSFDEFERFKNYILYAFNFIALSTVDLNVYSAYRLVVNESVTGKNESITSEVFLKYPPIEIVKKINKYNRANTPNTNIFYAAGSIDTALKEIRPPSNRLITIGIWSTKDANKTLKAYPISHSDEANNFNASVKEATQAIENINLPPLLLNYMRYYFTLLGREFSKRVNHHYEYLISALFAENIFSHHPEINNMENFKYDCIIYPSVGNDYLTENLAIIPATLDKDFYLAEVIEFEIEEGYYDRKSTAKQLDEITLAKIKHLRKTKSIKQNRAIEW